MKTKIKSSIEAYELLIAKLVVIAMILTTVLIFGSCKKDEDTTQKIPDIDTQTTKDESVAQSEYDEVLVISAEAVDSAQTSDNETVSLSIAYCAVVTIDTLNHKITVDFGESGCTGADGITRSGKIKISYIGYYREPGSAMSITFDNYTSDDYTVEGQLSYITLERNGEGNLQFTTEVINGKVTYPDGAFVTWNSTRTREWVSGELSGDIYDDVFQITGESQGINSNGDGFSSQITSPITIKTACWNEFIFYPVSGTKVIMPEHLSTRSIDYGDGSCDKIVYLTVGGYKYTVSLP